MVGAWAVVISAARQHPKKSMRGRAIAFRRCAFRDRMDEIREGSAIRAGVGVEVGVEIRLSIKQLDSSV
jgi:hypothetical protein